MVSPKDITPTHRPLILLFLLFLLLRILAGIRIIARLVCDACWISAWRPLEIAPRNGVPVVRVNAPATRTTAAVLYLALLLRLPHVGVRRYRVLVREPVWCGLSNGALCHGAIQRAVRRVVRSREETLLGLHRHSLSGGLKLLLRCLRELSWALQTLLLLLLLLHRLTIQVESHLLRTATLSCLVELRKLLSMILGCLLAALLLLLLLNLLLRLLLLLCLLCLGV